MIVKNFPCPVNQDFSYRYFLKADRPYGKMPLPASIKLSEDKFYVLTYTISTYIASNTEFLASAELFGPLDLRTDLRIQITPKFDWYNCGNIEDYSIYQSIPGFEYVIGDLEDLLRNQLESIPAILSKDRYNLYCVCYPYYQHLMQIETFGSIIL